VQTFALWNRNASQRDVRAALSAGSTGGPQTALVFVRWRVQPLAFLSQPANLELGSPTTLRDGDLWLMPSRGGEPTRVTSVAVAPIGTVPLGTYFRREVEIGSATWSGPSPAYAWSPDSKTIAVHHVDRRGVAPSACRTDTAVACPRRSGGQRSAHRASGTRSTARLQRRAWCINSGDRSGGDATVCTLDTADVRERPAYNARRRQTKLSFVAMSITHHTTTQSIHDVDGRTAVVLERHLLDAG
jgi:hypothetical protein